jgi:hypothetical protein
LKSCANILWGLDPWDDTEDVAPKNIRSHTD